MNNTESYIEKFELEKYREYIKFIGEYKKASNASTGSKFDSNANVEHKNVTTLTGEIPKAEFIGINRLMMTDKITELFGKPYAEEYIRQLTEHELYKHDETNPMLPYCVSITMYPFLYSGMKSIGGISTAPTNLKAFTGAFINLVFAIASQFAGAVSTPEFISYLDYFIRKEYGENYYDQVDKVVVLSKKPKILDKVITDIFEQITYSLNQPASARNYQSVFWNIAYFDKYYFNGMFENFIFPDGTSMKWESVSWLQKRYMKWFNRERLKTPLTFPVETMNLLDDGKDDFVDKEYKDFTAEMWAEKHSFFMYHSSSVDSLASCCRLRNELQDNTFSFTLGAGGVATGSKCVITMNLNRMIQNMKKKGVNVSDGIREETKKVHRYLIAYNELLKESLKAKLLTVYDAGYISLPKQFLTLGVNGFVEGAEFLDITVGNNEEYKNYCTSILRPIYEENKKARTKEIMFNTEFVPAENLGVKNAKWDKQDGYFVPRDCYNSYFYKVEDNDISIMDKIKLQGKEFTKYLDGGSALHLNLEEHLSKEQYLQLLKVFVITGCSYNTFNIPNTECKDCGYISKDKLDKCPKCGSENLDYITRIIGYLKRISKFSEPRQVEEGKRNYEKTSKVFND